MKPCAGFDVQPLAAQSALEQPAAFISPALDGAEVALSLHLIKRNRKNVIDKAL